MTRVQNVSSVSSEIEKKDDPTLKEVLYYPILMLKICGIYIECQGDKFRVTGAVIAKVTLNVVCMLILILIVIRISASFVTNDDFSDKLMGRIVFAVMYISNTVMLPVFVVTTTRKLPKILSKFTMFQTEYDFATDMKKLKRITTSTLFMHIAFDFIVGICIHSLVSFRILDESGLLIGRLLPFSYKDGYIFDLVSIIDMSAMQFCSIFIESETLIIFALSHIIIKEFQEVIRQVEIVREKDTISTIELHDIRQQHYKVAELLETANSILELNMFYGFMILLPGLCLTVYGIVYSTIGISDIIFLVSIFLMQLLGMILMIATGAKINSQAHGALRSLFALSLDTVPIETQYQLKMFIAQLSSQKIGINVYGLFTMDGSTFLMIYNVELMLGVTWRQGCLLFLITSLICKGKHRIFGTVVTYTIVVLEIHAGGCSVTQVNNCNYNCTT